MVYGFSAGLSTFLGANVGLLRDLGSSTISFGTSRFFPKLFSAGLPS
jgi:hypothetical protein